jgi:hypothetical protein
MREIRKLKSVYFHELCSNIHLFSTTGLTVKSIQFLGSEIEFLLCREMKNEKILEEGGKLAWFSTLDSHINKRGALEHPDGRSNKGRS